MRRLVTPFSSSNEPELIVRRHVILLNFDPLRAIALRDRLLVLVPEGADSILLDLEKRVRGGVDEMQKNIFGTSTSISSKTTESPSTSTSVSLLQPPPISSPPPNKHPQKGKSNIHDKKDNKNKELLSTQLTTDNVNDNNDNISSDNSDSVTTVEENSEEENELDDEWDDFEGMGWIDLTFELQSVDALLASVIQMLSDDATHLTKRVMDLLQCTTSSHNERRGDFVQDKLRLLKDEVKEKESRVQGFVRAMNLVLDETEDMALMNLSRLITNPERFIQPVPQHVLDEESDEPELILEAYLQQALSEVNALDLLKAKILNTEELVSLQMDTIRNRLLYINTMVTVISLCVAVGSFVGSIFGMNLTNGYEQDTYTFGHVVIGTVLGCFGVLVTLMYILHVAGSMPVSATTLMKY